MVSGNRDDEMRPIDADALIREIKGYFCDYLWEGEGAITQEDAIIMNYYRKTVKIIEDTPTIKRLKGEWEVLDECSNAGVYCSKCHKKVYNIGYSYNRIKMPYCPNCGSYNGHSVRGEE